ncbi:MAG: formylglycine-generating enzyme family protein [Pirellulales bacterium]|nr:formylglycine-generating enzyme family protein [Pirellulales bacterium]
MARIQSIGMGGASALMFAIGCWQNVYSFVGTGAVVVCFALLRAFEEQGRGGAPWQPAFPRGNGGSPAPSSATGGGWRSFLGDTAHVSRICNIGMGGASTALFAVGCWQHLHPLAGSGAVAVCFALLQAIGRRNYTLAAGMPVELTRPAQPPTPHDATGLVEQMIDQSRYALLLRQEIVANLSPAQITAARRRLNAEMTLVPAGEISVGYTSRDAQGDGSADCDELESRGTVVRIERFMLDRFCVSNEQFQHFVDAGGYEQMSIWEPDIWPGVLDFVDQTGCPGPRFWQHGRFPEGMASHPVVGVSWYEASAYARWVGKRLPTDPEWEKSASWPIQLRAANRPPRRFPWGNTFDPTRANLWGTGPLTPVAVDAYPAGITVGGAYQMVGNVWEWTTGNFGAWCVPTQDLILTAPARSLRGGAFDTYFDTQATCQFQSGEDPTARKHNIGFRCALSVCDLASEDISLPVTEETPAPESEQATDDQEEALEEVTA